MTRQTAASGFSLVELLITVAIVLAAAGAIFGLTYPAHLAFQAEPERADIQQRLRIAVESLSNDLMMAGAGGEQAGSATPLGLTTASIQPLRKGLRVPDLPGTFHDDRVSIVYVSHAAASTTLVESTAATTVVAVAPQAGCPLADPLCGFHINDLIGLYDESGAFDTFRLLAIQNAPPMLVGDGAPLSKTYAAGTAVAAIEAATYWAKHDTRAGTHQLVRYDGQQTDSPVVDNVLALQFQYFGESRPPALVRPLDDAHGPWTSYGPKPPPIDVDDESTTGYGAGENCVFAVDGGHTVNRPELTDLGGGAAVLARLEPARLVDGPWCPDAGSPNRFDADLLRIRRVRVILRIVAARQLLVARIPDIVISFDVGARNLARNLE